MRDRSPVPPRSESAVYRERSVRVQDLPSCDKNIPTIGPSWSTGGEQVRESLQDEGYVPDPRQGLGRYSEPGPGRPRRFSRTRLARARPDPEAASDVVVATQR